MCVAEEGSESPQEVNLHLLASMPTKWESKHNQRRKLLPFSRTSAQDETGKPKTLPWSQAAIQVRLG